MACAVATFAFSSPVPPFRDSCFPVLWPLLDPLCSSCSGCLGVEAASWFITYDAAHPARRPAAIPRNRFAIVVLLQKLRRAIIVPPAGILFSAPIIFALVQAERQEHSLP